MSLLTRVKDSFRILTEPKYKRTLADLYNKSAVYSNEPDFLDKLNSEILTAASLIFGLTEEQISPMSIYEMVNKDTYFPSLLEQITESVMKTGFYIGIEKDEDGNELGNKDQADEYYNMLEELNYTNIAIKIINGMLGDGGGNMLFSTVMREGRKLEFRYEPFLADGYPRVQVYGDNKLREVIKYEVVDANKRPIWTIDPRRDYYMHLRYNEAGNFLFSSNPAKKAVYWYIFKKYLSGAPLNSFKHGLQEPVIASPDYSALKTLSEVMNIGMVKSTNDASPKTPLEFFKKQSNLDDEILRTQVGNARKDNTLIKMHMPYNFEKVGRNNANMKTTELIDLCDKQIGYSLRTGQALLDARYSKYSNAEEEEDNWKSLVVSPLKKRIEMVAEKFFLPALDPKYDPKVYKVCFGRDPNAEQIELFKAKTERNSSIADIVTKLSSNPVVASKYTYNLETNEIEESEQPVEQNEETISEQEVKDQIEESTEFETNRTNEQTPAEKGINSKEGVRFNDIVKKAINKQLNDYSDKLKKKKSISDAIKNLEKDFKPITQYGINVNTYKNQLLKLVKNALKDDLLQVQKREEVPVEVVNLMDAKAQLMIKGYDSLTVDQQNLIKTFYGRELKNYTGFDSTTTEEINTILRNNLNKPVPDVVNIILNSIVDLSAGRAKRIIDTEIAQDIEASRRLFYKQNEYNEKRWVTVKDERVRPEHKANEDQGWINIDESFQNGAIDPSSEIACRCTVRYTKNLYKLNK